MIPLEEMGFISIILPMHSKSYFRFVIMFVKHHIYQHFL